MSYEMIGAIGVGSLLFLMFIGIPLGVSMALVGIGGYFVVSGLDRTLLMVGSVPYSTLATYTFSVLPVFLLMGEFADMSGMMRDSYSAANTWLSSFRGGLAMASVFGAALFSAVSGSSMACAAIMTRISLPTLLKYKYDPKLATGALAAGGTLGNLVPPGIAYVFYALMSETSVGRLYMASMIPGVLLTIMYLGQIYLQCRINPNIGPRGESTTWKQKLFAFKYAWALILVFGLVMGGIWFGVFTATEAGAVGAVATFIYALARRSVSRANFFGALNSVVRISGMVFAVIIGAQLFTNFITITRLAEALADLVVGAQLSQLGVIIAIMVLYFILGTALDTMSMILLTLPIFLSIATAMNIDLYWFGVLVIVQVELSNITPPVGMNLFVVSGMVKERGISMGTIFRGVLPFCLTMLLFNILLIAFPQISLFLVNTMK